MIVVVDYEAGNLTSVRLALESMGIAAKVTRAPADIAAAERVIFPGVGAAGAAMGSLKRLGLVEPLRAAGASGRPFLGICLGAQIVLSRSEEDGGTECLGILPGSVRLFAPESPRTKVPHMGWNQVEFAAPHPLFDGIESGSEFYFVHSYFPAPEREADVLARTDYAGMRFSSVIGRGNVVATQFHPEKSGRVGLRLLKNFCEWSVAPS